MSGDGSVYPVTVTDPEGKPRTVWIAQLSIGPRGSRSYRRRKRPTEAAAKRALKALRDDQAAGLVRTTHSLGSFLQGWLAETVDVRPNTRRGYEDAIAHWRPIFDIPLDSVRAEHIERCANRMMALKGKTYVPASPKTVRNAQIVLRSALRVAHERGYVRRNEALLVKLKTVPRQRREPLTPDMARRIVAAVAGDRLEAAYWLALFGLRESEILGLSWAAIDFERGTATIFEQVYGSGSKARMAPPKTEASADVVLLPPEILAVLEVHRANQRPERIKAGRPTSEGLVFVNLKGLAVNGSWFTKHFQRLLADAGLPRMTVHNLRHGYATLLAALQVHPSVAQRLMRHARPETTLGIYTHVTRDQERSASDEVGRLLGESPRESPHPVAKS
jgi:integrase